MNDISKVTIVTICYQANRNIEKTILSVISQDYRNIEYIIVDGGSTDGTVDIIRKYTEKISYWVSERDKGIYDAMNKGYAQSTGDWIMFVNSGDLLHNEVTVSKLVENADLNYFDIVYGDSIGITHDGNKNYFKASDGIPVFRRIPTFRHGASMMKKNSMPNPPFDISKKEFGFALDTNLIYQMIYKGKTFFHVNEIILDYEIEGISNNQLAISKYNYKIFTQYKFNIIVFLQYIKSYVYQSLKRLIL